MKKNQHLSYLNLGKYAQKGCISPRKGKKYPYNPHPGQKGKLADEKNKGWKGEKVGKSALHQWIERKLGKPKICENCGDNSDRKYAWANKSHEYKRDLADWIRLCYPCHMKYDKVGEKSWQKRRQQII